MNRYKILSKGVFESKVKFEERINSMALEGWRAISMTQIGGNINILMEKIK